MDLDPLDLNNMDLVDYAKKYDDLVMNLIMVDESDVEYIDEIKEFVESANYMISNNIVDTLDARSHREALIRFFNETKIGYDGNIFKEKSGTEIWLRLQELYEEVLNEE